MNKTYLINGIVVKSFYAGLDCFAVNDNVCYDLTTLAKWCGVSVEVLKEEMWKQR